MKNEFNLRIFKDYSLKSFAIILVVMLLSVAGSVSVIGKWQLSAADQNYRNCY